MPFTASRSEAHGQLDRSRHFQRAGARPQGGVATDAAYDMVHRLARAEALLVGQSSGAAMVAALEVARPLDRGCIVVLFPDFGDRYLSTNVWMAAR